MKQTTSRVFQINEQVTHIYQASKAFVLLKTRKPKSIITKQFKERIMLAITEVNGCEMCSFIHTKIALNSGMSIDEIRSLLGGTHLTKKEEAIAIIFAQQYAYTKETPSKEAISRLVEEYGFKKAELILGLCAIITMTNGMGTSMDYFYRRLRFRRYKKSNVLLEILNPLLTMILFPTLVLYHYFIQFFKEIKLLNRKYKLNFE